MLESRVLETDASGTLSRAKVVEGAIVYRLAPLRFPSLEDAVSGKGSVASRSEGRFHGVHQPASYLADNVLVCIAEVLFHMHRRVIDGILGRRPFEEIVSNTYSTRVLQALRARHAIGPLVNLESDEMTISYDPRLGGTATVCPDARYEPLELAHRKVRLDGGRGVAYLSARHSTGACLALFGDETENFEFASPEVVRVDLCLIGEDFRPLGCDTTTNPLRTRLHQTMGRFRVRDEGTLEKLRAAGDLFPKDMPLGGCVDFVRRQYVAYPEAAVFVR